MPWQGGILHKARNHVPFTAEIPASASLEAAGPAQCSCRKGQGQPERLLLLLSLPEELKCYPSKVTAQGSESCFQTLILPFPLLPFLSSRLTVGRLCPATLSPGNGTDNAVNLPLPPQIRLFFWGFSSRKDPQKSGFAGGPHGLPSGDSDIDQNNRLQEPAWMRRK